MMTKKDFKQLADMCAEIENEEDRCFLIRHLTHFCARNNPKFDNLRFEEWINRRIKGVSVKGLG